MACPVVPLRFPDLLVEYVVLWAMYFIIKDQGSLLREPKTHFSQVDVSQLLNVVVLALANEELAAAREEYCVASGGLDAGAGAEKLLDATTTALGVNVEVHIHIFVVFAWVSLAVYRRADNILKPEHLSDLIVSKFLVATDLHLSGALAAELPDARQQRPVDPPCHFFELFLALIEAALVLIMRPRPKILRLLREGQDVGRRLLHLDLSFRFCRMFLTCSALKVPQVKKNGEAKLLGVRATLQVVAVDLDRLQRFLGLAQQPLEVR